MDKSVVVVSRDLVAALNSCFKQNFLGPTADHLWRKLLAEVQQQPEGHVEELSEETVRHLWCKHGGTIQQHDFKFGSVVQASMPVSILTGYLRSLYGKLEHWRNTAARMGEPIPMVLHCPYCRAQHIDGWDKGVNWAERPHSTHLCLSCHKTFKPSLRETIGVKELLS